MKIPQLFLTLLIIAVITLPADAARKSRLHRVLEAGVLRVGTTGDWNPMTLRDPTTNSYKGYDIDVMKALAADMGVKLVFVPADWKTIVSGIMADKYDISTSASITPSRIRTVGFTRSYYQVATVPLTLKKYLARFRDWQDINQPGVTVR